MQRVWTTPGGEYSRLYRDMAMQPHMLIAGATGSGKSVVINGIIHSLLFNAPCNVGLILIDVKKVELSDYRHLPHTIAYADDVPGSIRALQAAINITEARYKDMQRRRERLYNGSDIYVVIDELADLMTTAKRQVTPLIQRLCQIGRAARVHVIAATQCPIAAVIPTPIKVNFDARLGLRTRSKQDSRNILGNAGCENLPRYGCGYYMTPEGTTLYKLPMIDAADRERLINHWTGRAGRGKLKLFSRG